MAEVLRVGSELKVCISLLFVVFWGGGRRGG